LFKGKKVLDKNSDEALGFVNVKITPQGATTLVKGAVTDVDGKFIIQGLENGQYTLTLTFVGYKNLTRNFVISDKNKSVNYPFLYLTEDAHTLKEVTVTGMKSAMKLEVDRKSYDVSQLITNSGDAASDVLENIPSVEVDNDGNISLRGNTSVEVWINGKASGLTSDNRAEILQQLACREHRPHRSHRQSVGEILSRRFCRHHQHRAQERPQTGLLRFGAGGRQFARRCQQQFQHQL
jgi:hypothetical protein